MWLMGHTHIEMPKKCRACGKDFVRTRYFSGVLEGNASFKRRKYCSQACADIGVKPTRRIQETPKECQRCQVVMTRKRVNGRLEDLGVFKRKKYCSLTCANRRDHPKSKDTYHWRARQHRTDDCEACGWVTSLHVHHIDGDVTHNDLKNLQTLCVYCHKFLHDMAQRHGRTVPGKMPSLA